MDFIMSLYFIDVLHIGNLTKSEKYTSENREQNQNSTGMDGNSTTPTVIGKKLFQCYVVNAVVTDELTKCSLLIRIMESVLELDILPIAASILRTHLQLQHLRRRAEYFPTIYCNCTQIRKKTATAKFKVILVN